MIRSAIIGAAVAVVPLAAQALELSLVPDCEDDQATYFYTEKVGGGLIYTQTLGGSSGAYEWLASCAAGTAVRADGSNAEDAFIDVVHGMMESQETYDFDEVAKFSREIGFRADVVRFDKNACVCGL